MHSEHKRTHARSALASTHRGSLLKAASLTDRPSTLIKLPTETYLLDPQLTESRISQSSNVKQHQRTPGFTKINSNRVKKNRRNKTRKKTKRNLVVLVYLRQQTGYSTIETTDNDQLTEEKRRQAEQDENEEAKNKQLTNHKN